MSSGITSRVAIPSAAPKSDGTEAVQVDVEGAIEQLDGMRSLYLDVAQQYLLELDTIAPEYRRLLGSDNMAGAIRLIHTLKGTAATLGIAALSDFAKELEAFCKAAAGPESALARADQLEAVLKASIAALTRVVEGLRAESAQ